jgi:hypothetical protein
MADSEQQVLWTKEVEHLLASPQQPAIELEHLLWGWQQRVELLKNLAAHAFTGGQPLVAASIYQQVGDLEDMITIVQNQQSEIDS